MTYVILQPSVGRDSTVPTARERVWVTDTGCVAEFFSSRSASGQDVTFGDDTRAAWVVNGRLFSHEDGAVAGAEVVVGTALVDYEDVSLKYWGNYSIIVYDRHLDSYLILSDPCGQHPVFYHQAPNGEVHVGNLIGELLKLSNLPKALDAHYLDQYAVYGRGEVTGTGWQGISLLPAGFALRWKRGQRPDLRRAWSPWKWHRRGAKQDFIEVLTMVQRSMLSKESKIFLELSGGVDSTSLAVGLRRAGLHRKAIAVTHFDPNRGSSNEVSIARAVAEHCQIEHRTNSLLTFLPFTPFERLPTVSRPDIRLCFLARDNGFAQAGLPGEDGVMLNGNGGDSLYLAPPPFSSLVDAAFGLRIGRVVGALRDLAVQYRLPVWRILSQAWQQATRYFGEPAFFDDPATQLAMPPANVVNVSPPGTSLYHDVLNQASLWFKPGRRYQITMLGASLEDWLPQIGDGNHRPVMPFLSQPIIEHALRLRIEDLFSADHSRLPVRRSVFSVSGLPNLWRTDKGDIMHSLMAGININHAHVRETCTNGWCTDRGLVDPDGMATLIKRAALGYPTGMREITRIYSIEMFVRGLVSVV